MINHDGEETVIAALAAVVLNGLFEHPTGYSAAIRDRSSPAYGCGAQIVFQQPASRESIRALELVS